MKPGEPARSQAPCSLTRARDRAHTEPANKPALRAQVTTLQETGTAQEPGADHRPEVGGPDLAFCFGPRPTVLFLAVEEPKDTALLPSQGLRTEPLQQAQHQ